MTQGRKTGLNQTMEPYEEAILEAYDQGSQGTRRFRYEGKTVQGSLHFAKLLKEKHPELSHYRDKSMADRINVLVRERFGKVRHVEDGSEDPSLDPEPLAYYFEIPRDAQYVIVRTRDRRSEIQFTLQGQRVSAQGENDG